MPKKSKIKVTPNHRQSLNHVALSKPALIVFVLIFAAIGGYAIYRSLAVGPGMTAHEFVSLSGSNTCTRNPSLVDYTTAATDGNVCLAFDKAYQIAQQGDTVPIETGKYGLQSITNDGTKTSANGRCYLGVYSNGDFPSPQTAGCVTLAPDSGV